MCFETPTRITCTVEFRDASPKQRAMCPLKQPRQFLNETFDEGKYLIL